MGKGGSKTTTTTNEIDPFMESQRNDLMGDINRYADRPYQAYRGQRVAGFNPDYTAGERMTRDAAAGLTGAVGDAAGVYRDVMSAGAPSFLDYDVQDYMNPFLGEVVDRSLADLDRSRQMGLASDAHRAAASGAFGGARHGVAEAETNRGYYDAAGRTAADLRYAGYRDATGQINNDMATEMANRGMRLDAAGRLVSNAGAGIAAGQARMNLGLGRQANEQQRFDAAYQEWVNGQNDPMRKLLMRASVLPTMPFGTTQTSREKTSGSGLGGLLGGALSIGSMFIPGLQPVAAAAGAAGAASGGGGGGSAGPGIQGGFGIPYGF